VQVNPVDWWDPHWVKDRILSKLGSEMGDAGVDHMRRRCTRIGRNGRRGRSRPWADSDGECEAIDAEMARLFPGLSAGETKKDEYSRIRGAD